MPNPFFDNRVSPNSNTAPTNPLNEDSKDYSRGYNKFDYNRVFFNTLRYADITPHEVIEAGFTPDKIPLFNKHDIRTHTLSSPLMSDVFMKKNYYAVDFRAILPNNWERIFVHPTIGDDVVFNNVNCVIVDFPFYLKSIFNNFTLWDFDEQQSTDSKSERFALCSILLLESFLSNGSLLSTFGCHLSPLFYSLNKDALGNSYSFDFFFDTLFNSAYHDEAFTLGYLSNAGYIGIGANVDIHVTPAACLDYIRNHPECIETCRIDGLYNKIHSLIDEYRFTIASPEVLDNLVLNISRCLAYQIVCAQFFTNDKIDYIFDAHRWLENQSYLLEVFSSNTHFSYNGIAVPYDIHSGINLTSALNIFIGWTGLVGSGAPFAAGSWYAFNYLYNIFNFNRNLRYGDYFTGSKSRPLAVGDTTTPVVNNGVSALDSTRNLMLQRFLNQLGRIGSRTVDYVRKILKGIPAPDVTLPRWLASSVSSVSGFEVENTAEEQGNIVTILRSSNSKYFYEVEVSEPCIILGVTTFEVPRVYSKSVDRFFFNSERFDYFNPFLQNIGDQDIMRSERIITGGTVPFAYTGRNMEYKQRYPIASGGFVEFLPSYAFITDNFVSESSYSDGIVDQNISPDYIRSNNSEFDRFYSSLTGVSLASYFHFIVKYENICDAVRMMEYNPTLL